jgi:hypothetical protein
VLRLVPDGAYGSGLKTGQARAYDPIMGTQEQRLFSQVSSVFVSFIEKTARS